MPLILTNVPLHNDRTSPCIVIHTMPPEPRRFFDNVSATPRWRNKEPYDDKKHQE